MNLLFGSCLFFLCIIAGSPLVAQEGETGFKKADFYNAMAGKNADAINKQLEVIKTSSVTEKNAYEGALLMKKAGIAGGPKKKLDLFKEGHKKLEAVLQKDSSNVEFRFLRLMIQEHAPGILGYKGQLENDSQYIRENFGKLLPVVQQAVREYSKKSIFLKSADL